jgi:hypothetical protein
LFGSFVPVVGKCEFAELVSESQIGAESGGTDFSLCDFAGMAEVKGAQTEVYAT